MKKFLISNVAVIMIVTSFAFTPNTFAVGLGNQSIDATVGEVDKIDTEKEQDIDAPNTGVFGLATNSESFVVAAFLVVPVVIFFICLFEYERHRRVKNKVRDLHGYID